MTRTKSPGVSIMKHVGLDERALPIAIKVDWVDELRFLSSDDKSHSIIMDTPKEHGGEDSGFGQMQLLLQLQAVAAELTHRNNAQTKAEARTSRNHRFGQTRVRTTTSLRVSER